MGAVITDGAKCLLHDCSPYCATFLRSDAFLTFTFIQMLQLLKIWDYNSQDFDFVMYVEIIATTCTIFVQCVHI